MWVVTCYVRILKSGYFVQEIVYLVNASFQKSFSFRIAINKLNSLIFKLSTYFSRYLQATLLGRSSKMDYICHY